MSKFNFPLAAMLFASLSAVAGEPYVTNLVVRQNWPWTGKVSINFTLVADTRADLDVTATHAGGTIDLTQGGLDHAPLSIQPGDCHFEWDPVTAGYGELKDLKISITPSTADHTYLVFNLETGAHEYLSAVPEGGWTDEYKTTKLVFRRIPGGAFTMGVPDEVIKTYIGVNDTRQRAHSVKISTDYYVAVFPMTTAQYWRISGGTASGGTTRVATTYVNLRGNLAAGINWPVSGHTVAGGSFIDKTRKLFGGAFLVDLATEAQWEHAARADAPGLWYAVEGFPDGGTMDELGPWKSESYTNILNKIAAWDSRDQSLTSTPVGTKLPNRFGLYDVCGIDCEWVLDYENLGVLGNAVDPVGITGNPASDAKNSRMRRGGPAYNTSSVLGSDATIVRRYAMVSTQNAMIRLAIHLVPLVK